MNTERPGKSCDLQSCVLEAHRVRKLPASTLLSEFAESVARDRGTTVEMLIQIAAIDARKLYKPLACSSAYTYCTDRLHMCEGTACRLIRAARAARKFPAILPLVAEGRLHLVAVSVLAPHLKRENVSELLAAATHLSKAQVVKMVAERFPKPDVATSVRALAGAMVATSPAAQVVANVAQLPPPVAVVPMVSAETVNCMGPLLASDESRALHVAVSEVVAAAARENGADGASEAVLGRISNAMTQTLMKAAVVVPASTPEGHAKATPLSLGRYAWQLTADQEMQDLLEEAKELSACAEARDLAHVLKRGLKLLVEALRKSRRAETARPQPQRDTANARHVPAALVREVWERDGHQCTFVAPDGHRCGERSGVEIDHVIPLARGGKTALDNVRLLCGPHNQHEAERLLGAEHVKAQRDARRARVEAARAAKAERISRAERKAGLENAELVKAASDTQAPPADEAVRGEEHLFPKSVGPNINVSGRSSQVTSRQHNAKRLFGMPR